MYEFERLDDGWVWVDLWVDGDWKDMCVSLFVCAPAFLCVYECVCVCVSVCVYACMHIYPQLKYFVKQSNITINYA